LTSRVASGEVPWLTEKLRKMGRFIGEALKTSQIPLVNKLLAVAKMEIRNGGRHTTRLPIIIRSITTASKYQGSATRDSIGSKTDPEQ
jgi:hypothetical protein